MRGEIIMPKKTFKNENNPAMQFISASPEEDSQENKTENIPTAVPMKRNPLYIETKSKRIQLLLQPSLHSKIKKISQQKETSINDLIHTILDQYTKKNK
jgi:hypothetical protein